VTPVESVLGTVVSQLARNFADAYLTRASVRVPEFDYTRRITIGLLVAIPVELSAAQLILDTPQSYQVKGDPATYYVGAVGDHSVAIGLTSQGNNASAIRATHMLRTFPNVKLLVMVGIAGAIPSQKDPDKHVRLGDVVVSSGTGVVQHDFVKRGSGGLIEERGQKRRPSSMATQLAMVLHAEAITAGFPDWHSRLDSLLARVSGCKRPTADVLYAPNEKDRVPHPNDPQRRPGYPRTHYGVIASGNMLVKDPYFRDDLKARLGALAIEMEGAGVADAAEAAAVEYLIVRGISDYADSFKRDGWHRYASLAAATYARCLIERLPPL
jgi:nucleoside phosphorylase